MTQQHYIQDSLSLRIDGERIPSVVPPVSTVPLPRSRKRRLQDARSHGVPEFKQCRVCNKVKKAGDFSRSSASTDQLNFRCKDCNRLAHQQRYRELSPEERRRLQFKHIKRAYGLSPAQYECMLAEQGGGCAICGITDHGGKNWHVDHDHETGAVRGILCQGCNHALGGARDNPDTLVAAAKYLWKRGK